MSKTDEAIAAARGRRWNSERLLEVLGELRGRIEALALRELLDKRRALDGESEGEGGDGEGRQEEIPRRRSRSL